MNPYQSPIATPTPSNSDGIPTRRWLTFSGITSWITPIAVFILLPTIDQTFGVNGAFIYAFLILAAFFAGFVSLIAASSNERPKILWHCIVGIALNGLLIFLTFFLAFIAYRADMAG